MPLFLPAFLINLGVGMLVPVLPLYLREVGLSYSGVTSVVAALGVGALVAQVPFGRFIARWGQNAAMILSALIIAVSTWLLGFTSVTLALIAMRFVTGIGSTGWLLSRHSFMTTEVPVPIRGRMSAMFGGLNRLAFFVGPLIGGFVADRYGFAVAFTLTGIVSAAGALPMIGRDEPGPVDSEPEPGRRSSTYGVFLEHRRALTAAGIVQICVISARQGRLVVIPLMGAAIGLDVREVGVLVAIGAFSELFLFPASGYLMDRFGRPAALVPFLTLFGGGLLLAAAASSPVALTVAAGATGFANGLGAGTLLTMGSDLAPPDDPSRFLSIIGLASDVGRISGPLVVGWMADAFGLSASAVVLAGLAFLGVIVVVFVLGDTRHAHATPETG